MKALIFDVFGTVVDWRSSVAKIAGKFAAQNGVPQPIGISSHATGGTAINHRWNGAKRRAAFHQLEALHRMNLDEIAAQYGFDGLSADKLDQLNPAWHHCPWPRLGRGRPHLAEVQIHYWYAFERQHRAHGEYGKERRLPWDVILGAEVVRQYKPMPETYDRCCDALGLAPTEVMMTAAHNDDLAAARARGLNTGFIPRPDEYGVEQGRDLEPTQDWDVVATDFVDLARKMGCQAAIPDRKPA